MGMIEKGLKGSEIVIRCLEQLGVKEVQESQGVFEKCFKNFEKC